jgi:hypothetical protein
MAADLFWSNVNTDPKRRFRFVLAMGNIPIWTVKTANKPKANISTVEHQFINHTFKYPGRVTWDNITVSLVDPIEPDLAKSFINALRDSGYEYPVNPNLRGSISKERSVLNGLGGISIQQINSEGTPIETWALKNPWIVSIDFGGALDYSADEMNEITVEIAYDWAEVTTVGNPVRQS